MSEILVGVICAVVSALGGAILFFVQRHFKRMEKHAECAEERTTKKDILILKSLKAIGELTVANAIAVRDGKTNGCTAKALKEFESVDKELNAFLLESAVKKVNKGGK